MPTGLITRITPSRAGRRTIPSGGRPWRNAGIREQLGEHMHRLRTLVLTLMLGLIRVSVGAAQGDASRSILTVALSEVSAGLRSSYDAQIDGPIAFDPRIVRAPQTRAPMGWPDSVMPDWVGNVRDSALAPGTVDAVLHDLNGPQRSVEWTLCGTTPESRQCTSIYYPAVVAVSEPWINGNAAQMLIYVRYRSSIDAHPHAWFASVVHLDFVDGRWKAGKWYNRGGT